jgi:mono/diheme cytochrome c family protein
MPAFDWKLGDDQIGAVLTYIRNSWGNAASAVSAADVANGKATLAKLR